MYESPINIVVGEMQTYWEQENGKMVLNAVNKVGVDVDKDELMKALRYDRDQYIKGYKDGQKDILNEIREHLVNDRYSEQVLIGESRYTELIDSYIELIDNMLIERREGTDERKNDEEETEAADTQAGNG